MKDMLLLHSQDRIKINNNKIHSNNIFVTLYYGWIDADNLYCIKLSNGCEILQKVIDILDIDAENSEDEDDEPQYNSYIDGLNEEEGMFSFEMLTDSERSGKSLF